MPFGEELEKLWNYPLSQGTVTGDNRRCSIDGLLKGL